MDAGAVTHYVCGHSAHELSRLAQQGTFFEGITRRALTRGGLRRGLRVLDIGCGAGDVSLLAGQLVGARGRVIGIDRVPAAVRSRHGARRRREPVTCRSRSPISTRSHSRVDAVIGRFVLMHQPRPAAALATAVRYLRRGGVVVMIESHMRCRPGGPLVAAIGDLPADHALDDRGARRLGRAERHGTAPAADVPRRRFPSRRWRWKHGSKADATRRFTATRSTRCAVCSRARRNHHDRRRRVAIAGGTASRRGGLVRRRADLAADVSAACRLPRGIAGIRPEAARSAVARASSPDRLGLSNVATDDRASEARRQSRLVSRRDSERDALRFVIDAADLQGWS